MNQKYLSSENSFFFNAYNIIRVLEIIILNDKETQTQRCDLFKVTHWELNLVCLPLVPIIFPLHPQDLGAAKGFQ